MNEEELIKLKAQVYDINVEQNKLGKKWGELKKEKDLLQKQIEAEKKPN